MAKYKAYPEYKDSGVEWLGMVPSHWKTISIHKLFSRVKRTGYTEKELLSVYRDYGVIPKSSRDDNNNKPSEDLSPYQLVKPNDMVMNKMKAWQGSIAISTYEGIVSPAYFVYKPNNVFFEVTHPRYVHYLLRNPIYVTQYLRCSKGIRVNQWDLDPYEFRNIELLLPDKTEQEKIYRFLDHETAKIDNLIEKQQQLIELLKEKRQAVISHAVTKGLNPYVPMKDSGVEWLGEVPAHWDICLLKFKCSAITDGAHISADTNEGKHYFVSIKDIKKGIIDFNNSLLTSSASYKYLVKTGCKPFSGDILFSKDGTIGQTAIVPDDVDFVVASSLIIIRADKEKALPAFMDLLLQSSLVKEQVESFVKGAALRRLSIQNLEKVFGVFPTLSEQLMISDYIYAQLNRLDVLESKAVAQIQLLEERRTALISAAVTGKIDVRDWVAPDTQKAEKPEETAV